MHRLSIYLLWASSLVFIVSACGSPRHVSDEAHTLESSPSDPNNTVDNPTETDVQETQSDAGPNDASGGQGDSDGTGGGSDNGTSGGAAGACERTGFPQATQSRAQANEGGWLFEATNDDLSEFVNISSFVNWQGPTVPGVYNLSGINYRDCGLCLLAGTNCSGGSCETLYYAHEGTVEVTSTGTEDGVTVAGALRNVVFEEVTIGDDYTTTRVPNGSTWCFDYYTFSDVAVDPNAPEEVDSFSSTSDSCVAGGNGTGLGNNIDNLQLPNCNGDVVSLHDDCGSSAAVWYVQTAGWCGACDFWIPRVEALYEQEAAHGLEVYYVLGQDASSGVPTADYCTQYATDKGIDPARVLIDNGADGAWGTFNQSIDTYDAGYIPWNAVLRGSNMEYIWADNVTNGIITDLKQALDSALGKDVDMTPMLQE